jgi:hypothetical protein
VLVGSCGCDPAPQEGIPHLISWPITTLGPHWNASLRGLKLGNAGDASWKLGEGYVWTMTRLRAVNDGIPHQLGIIAQPLRNVYLCA